VVGAPGGDFGSTKSGAAYVFAEPTAGWANMTQAAKVTAADSAGVDEFGNSVAISGGTLVVGAPEATVGVNVAQGAAYVFGSTASKSIATEATPPTITSAAIKSATTGQKYAYPVKANASAGQKITFSLRVAPPGMSINASTGLVAWSPTAFQTGTSAVTVLATDQFGNVAQQAFSISVSRSFAIYAPSCWVHVSFCKSNRGSGRPADIGAARTRGKVGS
jgi:hypothetical protein